MCAAEALKSKRIFDTALALTGLILFSPLLFTIMVMILLEDGQVTRIGYWIRKTGLIETLQFINVLYGSMSLVGPSPMARENLERLHLHQEDLPRFNTHPGITGIAQLYAGYGFKVTQLYRKSLTH
jgi:lipopolysaccharide/colanic/teichoic acid biosynthesis glycosyltransferase